MQLANAAEVRKQQMISYLRNTFNPTASTSSTIVSKNGLFSSSWNGSELIDINKNHSKYESFNQTKTYSFITNEVADATCQCLIAQAEECQEQNIGECETERYVLEEFGRCLIEIIESAENNNICVNNDI